MDVFGESFAVTFAAVFEIAIVIAAAGFLVRSNIIGQNHLKAVSTVTVYVFLPCMIFGNIVRRFEPGEFGYWYLLPISAILMIGAGLGLAVLLFYKQLPQKKNMLSLASMQNANYLVLPIGRVVFADKFETFTLYCFLFLLGISPVLWSLGKWLNSNTDGGKLTFREIITPPFVANFSSVLIVLIGLRDVLLPISEGADLLWYQKGFDIVVKSVEFLGSATVPAATFVLGGMLGGISLVVGPHIRDAVKVSVVKLIAVPVVVIGFLYVFVKVFGVDIPPLLSAFWVIEASAAPATAHILQIKTYGGDDQKSSCVVLLSYICCILTIPFWLAVWQSIS